jgi:hypothetical protein
MTNAKDLWWMMLRYLGDDLLKQFDNHKESFVSCISWHHFHVSAPEITLYPSVIKPRFLMSPILQLPISIDRCQTFTTSYPFI